MRREHGQAVEADKTARIDKREHAIRKANAGCYGGKSISDMALDQIKFQRRLAERQARHELKEVPPTMCHAHVCTHVCRVLMNARLRTGTVACTFWR